MPPPRPSPEVRALRLVETLYGAPTHPSAWGAFVEGLAWELGEPMIGLNLEIPGATPARISYRVHSDSRYGQVFADYAARGALPWPIEETTDRFVRGGELFPDEELPKTSYYREYMEPQGLVPEGVIGHLFAMHQGRPVAAIGIYRRQGCRKIDEQDLVMCNLLVPHLARAYGLFRDFATSQHRRAALAEAIDFLPFGLVFLDGQGKAVAANRAAELIADRADGFSLEGGRPAATQPRAASEVRGILDDAVKRARLSGHAGHQPFTIPRPGGLRPYAAWVSTLHEPSEFALETDPVALLFLNDPDKASPGMESQLRALYALTGAEAELTRLLCEGLSIEQAADVRGVSLHTARAQLKSTFAKTGTRRQGELVSMALRSVTPGASMGETADLSLRDGS